MGCIAPARAHTTVLQRPATAAKLSADKSGNPCRQTLSMQVPVSLTLTLCKKSADSRHAGVSGDCQRDRPGSTRDRGPESPRPPKQGAPSPRPPKQGAPSPRPPQQGPCKLSTRANGL